MITSDVRSWWPSLRNHHNTITLLPNFVPWWPTTPARLDVVHNTLLRWLHIPMCIYKCMLCVIVFLNHVCVSARTVQDSLWTPFPLCVQRTEQRSQPLEVCFREAVHHCHPTRLHQDPVGNISTLEDEIFVLFTSGFSSEVCTIAVVCHAYIDTHWPS